MEFIILFWHSVLKRELIIGVVILFVFSSPVGAVSWLCEWQWSVGVWYQEYPCWSTSHWGWLHYRKSFEFRWSFSGCVQKANIHRYNKSPARGTVPEYSCLDASRVSDSTSIIEQTQINIVNILYRRRCVCACAILESNSEENSIWCAYNPW